MPVRPGLACATAHLRIRRCQRPEASAPGSPRQWGSRAQSRHLRPKTGRTSDAYRPSKSGPARSLSREGRDRRLVGDRRPVGCGESVRSTSRAFRSLPSLPWSFAVRERTLAIPAATKRIRLVRCADVPAAAFDAADAFPEVARGPTDSSRGFPDTSAARAFARPAETGCDLCFFPPVVALAGRFPTRPRDFLGSVALGSVSMGSVGAPASAVRSRPRDVAVRLGSGLPHRFARSAGESAPWVAWSAKTWISSRPRESDE